MVTAVLSGDAEGIGVESDRSGGDALVPVRRVGGRDASTGPVPVVLRHLDVGSGALLSFATLLLTFVYPTEYVFYEHGLMSGFFETYGSYDVLRTFYPGV